MSNSNPQPGDIVKVINTNTNFIQKNTYGIIINNQDHQPQSHINIIFNYTNPWCSTKNPQNITINACGGPQKTIPTEPLESTNQQIQYELLDFSKSTNNQIPQTKKFNANIWTIDLKNIP